ncbi:subunit A of DNA-directed RNA polymerase I [Chloropicon primus]|uniref:DNA-directed RNA polymerase subunit n=2 Tax=Chloropicon primus TaxID=1764295 RepID=A0A5B8MXJ4_9CHLO|nr:subunit A of DNA-directed RNA polymerase I [Chloropicon primus]UPR04462.1 subunit A of DNA-directed RNA polymerase I [Chloropicon primus]|eukprot:QDZ25257.1 subunit A of DNA-directed RNA polymerase I [Chloropicon primus]
MVHLISGKTSVFSTSLSTYTPSEVRQFSSVCITVPSSLDPLTSAPIPSGLYDTRMGPADIGGVCTTCRLPHSSCPGHFGHIELCLPLYNPLFLKFTVQLLSLTCHKCFSLKASDKVVREYAETLRRLRNHPKDSCPSSSSSSSSMELYQKTPQSYGDEAAAQTLLEKFFSECDVKTCTKCKASSPKYVLDNNSRILQVVSDRVTDTGAQSLKKGGGEASETEEDSETSTSSDSDSESSETSEELGSKKAKKEDKKKKKTEAEAEEVSRKQPSSSSSSSSSSHLRFISPKEVKMILDRTAVQNHEIFGQLMRTQSKPCSSSTTTTAAAAATPDASFLFLSVLPVTPPRFRPMSKVNDEMFDHQHNIIYTDILNANLKLASILDLNKKDASSSVLLQELQRLWVSMQENCNKLLMGDQNGMMGLQNLIEKKEGIFRMNMMGKRVNYAARSVISPDPYISLGEIGIPPYFAERLSFPEHVNAHNAASLAKRVKNGGCKYPGALMVEDERNGSKIHLTQGSNSKRDKLSQLIGVGEGKIVHRHAQTGDVVLVNRQPTLHKPSILAHNCRVLQGERTIRLHYANCSGYNADFDGDEINLHLPQDQMSRAEAYTIMHSSENFNVPTDGKPIKGLIQDHVISSVYLTMQDTFLDRKHYELLVYEACCMLKRKRSESPCRRSAVQLLPPTLLKPQRLWTGKQVISSVLANVLGDTKFSFTGDYKTKVAKTYFCKGSLESQVYVRNAELIHGVVDKAQYGKYGLVHSVQELYGADTMSNLMSCFSRLYTKFLQLRGFTCSIDDLLLDGKSEASRRDALKQSSEDVNRATMELLGMDDPSRGRLEHNLRQELLGHNKEAFGARFDAVCTGALNSISSVAVNSCLPAGSTKQFPKNNFNMMTCSGAKGSMVNHSQISVLLGQQTLEGRRVPRMESGKTLPCFLPYTLEPRSCGFIADRFLTGLQPQEYYFHCMAGREGLVDTTVKTARSGYLQRCLVKSLESLSVKYDGTVRDGRGDFKPKSAGGMKHQHGSIVQFRYGEDGVDPTKESYLYKFNFLVQNCMPLAQRLKHTLDLDAPGQGAALRSPQGGLGRFNRAWDEYAAEGKDDTGILMKKSKKRKKEKKKKGGRSVTEEEASPTEAALKSLLAAKLENSLSCAGDAVGVVAAQSIGEPSTQMTLNTFHHAGRGEANVTLGIPRLRELLMTATKEIKTPFIKVPFAKGAKESQTKVLASRLRKIGLLEILKGIQVSEKPIVWDAGRKLVVQTFHLKLKFHPLKAYREQAGVMISKKMIFRCITSTFCAKVSTSLKAFSRKAAQVTPDAEIFHYLGKKGDGGDTESCAPDQQEDEDSPFEACIDVKHESLRKIPMLELCEKVSMQCVVNETAGVDSADKIAMDDNEAGLLVQGKTGNLLDCLQRNCHVVDLTRLESNDIHMMQDNFGIEAARRVLENEVIKVFGAYGIEVDPRHLSLVSDFMTHTGRFTGCSRTGTFPKFGSPFLQMSFETATQFLRKSVLFNTLDEMTSPSSNIACGQLVTTSGTGLCNLYYKKT